MRLAKFLHIIGLSLFAGSIGGHILFSAIADQAGDLAQVAALRWGLELSVRFLTLPGLGLLWLSGLLMLAKKPGYLKARWLLVKLGFAGLITVNGVFILTPLVGDLSGLAADAVRKGTLSDGYWTMRLYEDIAGTINLVMVLFVVVMACYKPALKRIKKAYQHRDNAAAQ